MKKNCITLLLLIFLTMQLPVSAHHCSSHAYVTHKDHFQEEQTFVNCDKHSVLKETTVYFYSNGTRRSYVTNTIFNSDGSVLESGCSDVKHLIHNNTHYFTFYKNKKYQVIDEKGNCLTIKKYKSMKEVAPNKLLVKLDKKYGIIDLRENILTPIKYQKFEQVGKNLFLTKLNGYYGMINSSNKIRIKNEYDKISSLYNVFILKKEGKFGIANKSGKIIIPVECDSVKKMCEFILVKKENKYGLVDYEGNLICDIVYKKIQLDRNTLKCKDFSNNWGVFE